MAAGGAETVIQFGISLVPATERLDRLRELVRAADEATLDLIGIQDHPYRRRFLDTWSLIPALLTVDPPAPSPVLCDSSLPARGDRTEVLGAP